MRQPPPAGCQSPFQAQCAIGPQCLPWRRTASRPNDSNGVRCCNSGGKADLRRGRQRRKMALPGESEKCTEIAATNTKKHSPHKLPKPRRNRSPNIHSLVLRKFATPVNCWRFLHDDRHEATVSSWGPITFASAVLDVRSDRNACHGQDQPPDRRTATTSGAVIRVESLSLPRKAKAEGRAAPRVRNAR